MRVQELIEQLQKYPSQMLVVMSRDEEGNGFQRVHDLSVGRFIEGEYSTYPDEYEEYGYNREGSEEAICIWP